MLDDYISPEARWIRSGIIPQTLIFVRDLKPLVFGALADISDRANEASRQHAAEVMAASDEESVDLSIVAEESLEAGVAVYNSLTGMKQTLLNLFAAGLYQLFEQQATSFYRQETNDFSPDVKVEQFQKWLLDSKGVDVRTAPSWPLVYEELRHVANVIKHAEGKSAVRIRSKRPDLFTHPDLRSLLDPTLSPGPMQVFTPLAGEDIFVDEATFDTYANHLIDLWQWLADRV